MAGPRFLVALMAILLHVSFNSAARSLLTVPRSTDFIRRSCSSTRYPRLCYSSLSEYASAIQTNPKLLACTALNVTLSAAKSTSHMMVKLSRGQDMTPLEVGAMKDCVEELGDSVDEIRRSIDEMASARQPNFRFTMSNVQTWVSAALTGESTCSDGFSGEMMDGKLKAAVRGRIVKISQLTSNALAFINQYASRSTLDATD